MRRATCGELERDGGGWRLPELRAQSPGRPSSAAPRLSLRTPWQFGGLHGFFLQQEDLPGELGPTVPCRPARHSSRPLELKAGLADGRHVHLVP